MNTSELYEQWKQTVERQSAEQALQDALLTAYESRFGAPPPEITEAVEVTHDPATLKRWVGLFSAHSRDEIDAALRAERGDATSS